MKTLALGVIVLLVGIQETDSWRILFYTASKDRKSVDRRSARSDGTDLRSETVEHEKGDRSPDGKRRVFVVMWESKIKICVSDTEGKYERDLTDGKSWDSSPKWSPDGKQIVFTSNRSGKTQIWIMDSDGANPAKLTDHADGANQPEISPAGDRIAYMELHLEQSKLPPSTLRTMDLSGRDSKVLLERIQILEHAWSPKGDRIACSLVQELRILEIPSGKAVKSFKFEDVHKNLNAHAAYTMQWRPDGGAIACSINFLGGRKEGAEDFGDTRIFVLPFKGKSAIIDAGGHAWPVRWIK